jgi:hypothetical protein
VGAYSKVETCYKGPCADGHALYGWADIADAEAAAFSANVALTYQDLFSSGICYIMQKSDKIQAAFFNSIGSAVMYEGVNFLRGFDWWGTGWVGAMGGSLFAGERWVRATDNAQIEIVPYTAVTGFDYGYSFMNDFFTADKSPDWEDDAGHDRAIGMITGSLQGADTTCLTHGLEPRFPFDHDMLMKAAWKGFTWFDFHEIKCTCERRSRSDRPPRLVKRAALTLAPPLTKSPFALASLARSLARTQTRPTATSATTS